MSLRLYSVPFSYSDVKKHNCLLKDEVNPDTARDCVINTLYFMKMFKKSDAEIYARVIHNKKMNGLSENQIINLIFEQFTAISKSQDAIIKLKQISLNDLDKLMENNTCTFVGFYYNEDLTKFGHAVVVFKNNQGVLGIYDGQTQKLVNTEEGIIEWFKLFSRDYLTVLYESNKRIRISGQKTEKPPLKRIRKGSHEKSASKSKSKSKTDMDMDVDVLSEKPLTETKTETKTKYNLEIKPVVQDKNKKLKSQTRKKHSFIKKALKHNGLENNRQLRISQKNLNDRKKRENLFKINRQHQEQKQSETVLHL